MKETPFKQTKPFGCEHYTLANFFNDERYLKDIIPNAASYHFMLYESLQKYNPEIFLDSTFLSNRSFDWMPEQMQCNKIFEFLNYDKEVMENLCAAYFMVIKRNAASLFHAVLVIRPLNEDYVYMVDSMRDYIIKIKTEVFYLDYDVIEVCNFQDKQHTETDIYKPGTTLFNRNQLKHLL